MRRNHHSDSRNPEDKNSGAGGRVRSAAWNSINGDANFIREFPIRALVGKMSPRTNLSGYPTYQELQLQHRINSVGTTGARVAVALAGYAGGAGSISHAE